MNERYKSVFFTILGLTLVWLIIILLYLPRGLNDVNEQWTSSSSALKINRNQEEGPSFYLTPQQHDEDTSTFISHLSRDRQNHHQIRPPEVLGFMKYFDINKHMTLLNKIDTLFYEFNPKGNFENNNYLHTNSTLSIDKKQHEKETLELSSVRNHIDQYVRNEGNKLFAFNLLASNRIGLIRPLPDTRNAKCLTTKTNSFVTPHPSSKTINIDANSSNLNYSHSTSNSDFTPSNVIKLKASIIICYYNEAPSALLRTIYTVMKRSPIELIEEIIVVDDYSNLEYHFSKFKPFIDASLVKLVRTEKREGLIRARLFGAELAKGDVLIFLDSHVEANENWLEPLLHAVEENQTTIACPMIDLINPETLIYSSSPMVKGGLNWALNFKWDSVPSSKLKTYDDFVKPIETPTMAGGLYAIDRRFFYRLGAYDTGMELWGGENVEFSLRAWMCGGRIFILPCSRLGHIFRKRRPYGPAPDQPDSLLINTHRTARVWLDEYIDKFYESSPDARYLVSGDISQRLEIRHRLKCHDFSWFLDNIYPNLKKEINTETLKVKQNLFSQSDRSMNNLSTGARNNRLQRQVSRPNSMHYRQYEGENESFNNERQGHKRFFNSRAGYLPKLISQFQIQSSGSNFCIESKGAFLAKGFTRLVLNQCAEVRRNVDGEILIHNSSILDQLWTETELHDYRLGDNQCLDLIKNLPLLRKCHNMGTLQVWSHDNQTSDSNIYNSGGLCLGVERVQAGEPIIVTICDKQNSYRQDITANSTTSRKRRHKSRNVDKVFPNWLTGSTIIGKRYIDIAINPLKPSQKWNLIFINNMTNSSQLRSETS